MLLEFLMYKKFLINKEKLFCLYNGYDLSSILSFDIAFFSYGNKRSLLREIMKIFFAKDIRPPEVNSPILFSMGPYNNRKDYSEILDYVMSQVGVKEYFNLNNCKYKIRLSIKGLLVSFKNVFLQKINFSFKVKLLLFVRMVHYINTIELLGNNNFNYSKYCGFCTAHPYECILDKYFRLNNLETYSLQHGLYVFPQSPQMDVIAFDNMISDYILCWGAHTANEFSKYGISSEKIKIAGYPRNIKKLEPYHIPNRCRILFLCARKVFDDTNHKVMNFLSSIKMEMNTSISIKTHPSLDKDKYNSLCQNLGFRFFDDGTVMDALSSGEYDIIVTYNSSAYFDAYIGNRFALKYVDEKNEIFIDVTDDTFSSFNELKMKIKVMIESSNDRNTWDNISDKLSSTVGFGLNNYGEILNNNAYNHSYK